MKLPVVMTKQGWWVEARHHGFHRWYGPYRWHWQARLRGWWSAP